MQLCILDAKCDQKCFSDKNIDHNHECQHKILAPLGTPLGESIPQDTVRHYTDVQRHHFTGVLCRRRRSTALLRIPAKTPPRPLRWWHLSPSRLTTPTLSEPQSPNRPPRASTLARFHLSGEHWHILDLLKKRSTS